MYKNEIKFLSKNSKDLFIVCMYPTENVSLPMKRFNRYRHLMKIVVKGRVQKNK